MCNVLKDHICRVEQVLEVGANDRMELQKSGGQRYEQYQVLFYVCKVISFTVSF